MLVFVILLFAPILIQLVSGSRYQTEKQRKNHAALTFFFVWLTILIMLRHDTVGNDTRNYIRFFNSCFKMSWSQSISDSQEIGYFYFNKIVSLITEDPQVFLAIAAIVVSALMYPTYKRLCIDSTLTIVLFLSMSTFVMMFSGIRQMIAIALGFLAYEFTRKKQIILFVIVVAVAMTIHTSAFMIALMYPIYHVPLKKEHLFGIVPLMGILFIFNEPIFSFLGEYIEKYTRFEAEISSSNAYTMLVLFVFFTAFAFLIPSEKQMDRETMGLRNFLIVALALQMFAPVHVLAMRMNYYYIIFIPLLIPKIISCSHRETKGIAYLARYVMIVFFVGYFLYNIYTSGGGLNVFPYHFYWENVNTL